MKQSWKLWGVLGLLSDQAFGFDIPCYLSIFSLQNKQLMETSRKC